MMACTIVLFMIMMTALFLTQSEPELTYAFANATRERLTAFKEDAEKLKNIVFSVWGDSDPYRDAFNRDPQGFQSPLGAHPGPPYNAPASETVNSPYAPKNRPYLSAGDPADPLNESIRNGDGQYSLPHGNSHTSRSYFQGQLGITIPGLDQDFAESNSRSPKGMESGRLMEHAAEAFQGRRHHARTYETPCLLVRIFSTIFDWIEKLFYNLR